MTLGAHGAHGAHGTDPPAIAACLPTVVGGVGLASPAQHPADPGAAPRPAPPRLVAAAPRRRQTVGA